MKKKVLFVCTGNSCRSQIAEGLLRNMAGNRIDVYSAGSHPSKVHPNAIAVMDEWGINISRHTSNSIDDYLNLQIDVVITVCDNANQICPIFSSDVERIHWSIKDPFQDWNSDPLQLDDFRKTRQSLKKKLKKFIEKY